ncbi:hypothetical protein GBAR_LOCUS30580 [Geodia barretti]|uniref:Uncharacterized protein n=1 Tax=Geodia barretti TaxID=519541 RepID=A0AA35TYD2_GEOBA|nr:hypothetical protein GBAR_LOCUS30580 [Geodia barretti]
MKGERISLIYDLCQQGLQCIIESFEHNASTLLDVMRTLVQRMITEWDQQASHRGRPRIRIEEEQLRFFGGN